MDVSRRDLIRLGTSAAVTMTAVAPAGRRDPAGHPGRSVGAADVVPSLCYS
jgi:hypothetical protein